MKTFHIKLGSAIEAKTKEEAIKQFWEFVDDAENHDLSITED